MDNTFSTANTSTWHDAWRRLRKNKAAMSGLVVLSLIILISLGAPFLSPYSYAEQNLDVGATPPSSQHWLGSDLFGRDMLTRIIYGSRISLAVGFIATSVSLIIGVLWGASAGYFGGRIDNTMMRIVDILYALPFTIFIILLMVAFGRNIWLLFLAIGAVEWLVMARIVRGQVLHVKQQDFVEAARGFGLSKFHIIFKHIIPNITGPVIVYATLTVPNVILLESFLSFLGLGVQPPQSSWGVLIAYGVETMEEYPWLLLFPACILSLTLFSLNFLGDGLRDAFDVRD